MSRRKFSRNVSAEIMRRATRNNRVHCEGCHIDLTGKPFEIDHVIAENLILDKTIKLTAKDGQVLGKFCCHRGPEGKTAKDVKIAAKAKRQEASNFGIKTPPKVKMKSAGFPKAAKPERSKAVLPPRNLYQTTN